MSYVFLSTDNHDEGRMMEDMGKGRIERERERDE
jgi:hypothetical protein